MRRLDSLELPRHRHVFLCLDRSPTGSQREGAQPLKVIKLSWASVDPRQHTAQFMAQLALVTSLNQGGDFHPC